ncbi:MAG: sugar ABC transporter substrate-binding protein [Rectinemataceae bacterium]
MRRRILLASLIVVLLTTISLSTIGAQAFTPAKSIKAPAGTTLVGLPADVRAPKQIRIACLMVQNNPFGMAVMQGTLFAKEILKDRNCKVDWISVPDFDPPKWESALQNCITAQYDAITLFGLSEALQPVVDQAVDAGILVYTFNTEPGMHSKRSAYWGQDGFAGGKKCGQLLMDAVGGSGKYAIITGSFNVLGHELRRKGARSVLDANPKMELIGEFENQDKAEEAYNVTQNLLTSHPDIKGIYVTAGGPFGAAKAIKDAGLTGKVKLVCHDWMAETVGYIRSGQVTACLDQDPFNQGYAPVVAAFNKLAANITPQEINWFPGDVATPANVNQKIPLKK